MEEIVIQIYGGIIINKALTKHISCECKCKVDGRNCNPDQWWRIDKKRHLCEKDYVWNPGTCNCENGKYLASIMDDSSIMCNEIIESYKEETNFNKKKATCNTQNFYVLLSFLLITIALLIAVGIYCCLKKYRANQKNVSPFHFKNRELKEIIY